MAKIDLRFLDFQGDGYIKAEADTNALGTHYISLEIKDFHADIVIDLLLDKSTAIKFAKTLRTEINKIVE